MTENTPHTQAADDGSNGDDGRSDPAPATAPEECATDRSGADDTAAMTGDRRSYTRRSLLSGLGLAGLAGLGTANAAGQTTDSVTPRGTVGTSTYPVERVYAQSLSGGLTGGSALTSLVGDGLAVEDGHLVPVLGPDLAVDGETDALVTVARSVGDGAALFDGRDDAGLRFRSVTGAGSVSVSTSGNEVTVHGTNTTIDVSNDGRQVVDDADDLDFAGTLTASDDTDNTATVRSAWTDAGGSLAPRSAYGGLDLSGLSSPTVDVTGGTLTVPTLRSPAGTALTLKTDAGTRALELGVPASDGNGNTAGGNVVAGHPNNSVADSAVGAVVGGGGAANGNENAVRGIYGVVSGGFDNTARKTYSTVGGGKGNTAYRDYAAVLGGENNTADGNYSAVLGGRNNDATGLKAAIGGGGSNSTDGRFAAVFSGAHNEATGVTAVVGGGRFNSATADRTTVGGGDGNAATAKRATVGGGANNEASGDSATVPGGKDNVASGDYSLAAGRQAFAENAGTPHHGAFAWGDSSSTDVTTDANDQFVVQAGGGATIYSKSDLSTGVELAAGSGSWSSLSARAAKSDIEAVDPESVLEAVGSMDVATWRYDGEDEDVRHIGPMAEDFAAAFGLGQSDHRITNVDADGVAFAAIKGLSERLDAKDERIDELEDETAALRQEADDLREENADLRAENRDLREETDALREEDDALREAVSDLRERLSGLEARVESAVPGGIDDDAAAPSD